MEFIHPPFPPGMQLNPFGTGSDATDLENIPEAMRRYRIRDEDDLVREFAVSELDRHAEKLGFASTHISPLHKLRLEGRKIVVTEDPRLHLVTSYSKIFLKPLPPYLALFNFWEHFKHAPIRPAMLGHLRSWCDLIQHESDFRIAMKGDTAGIPLLPPQFTWDHFQAFSARVAFNITDRDVSPRFTLKELKLSRLNLVARILFGRSKYYELPEPRQPVNWPHFFIGLFALFSVILSAMQVVLAVESLTPRYSQVLPVFRWSSVAFLLLFCIGFVAILALGLNALYQKWQTARRPDRTMRKWDKFVP